MDEDHDGGDGHGDDLVLGLGKEEREKQNAQGKGIFEEIQKIGIFDRSSLSW